MSSLKEKIGVKEKIVLYLRDKRDWQWGGPLQQAIHDITGGKADMVARRLRELTEETIPEEMKLVEKKYAKFIDGKMEFVDKGGNVVYRFKGMELKQNELGITQSK